MLLFGFELNQGQWLSHIDCELGKWTGLFWLWQQKLPAVTMLCVIPMLLSFKRAKLVVPCLQPFCWVYFTSFWQTHRFVRGIYPLFLILVGPQHFGFPDCSHQLLDFHKWLFDLQLWPLLTPRGAAGAQRRCDHCEKSHRSKQRRNAEAAEARQNRNYWKSDASYVTAICSLSSLSESCTSVSECFHVQWQEEKSSN